MDWDNFYVVLPEKKGTFSLTYQEVQKPTIHKMWWAHGLEVEIGHKLHIHIQVSHFIHLLRCIFSEIPTGDGEDSQELYVPCQGSRPFNS